MQNKNSTPEFGKKQDEISILNLLLKAKEYLIYLLNRSYFKKFGITVAELTLFMQKQD